MAKDPGHVRLAERLNDRVLADVNSGWSISGLDVKEFPDPSKYPNAARFVRDKLKRGALEPASKAEYEEVEESYEESRERFSERLETLAALGLGHKVDVAVHQEGRIQEEARQRREAILEKRAKEGAENEDERGAADHDDEDYSTWTNDKLREELSNRDLETSGNKADLVARLEENDAEEEEEE